MSSRGPPPPPCFLYLHVRGYAQLLPFPPFQCSRFELGKLLEADNLDKFLELAATVGTPGFIIKVLRSHSRKSENIKTDKFNMKLCEDQAVDTLNSWQQLEALYSDQT
jgi:hypothetical protein